MPAIGGTVIAEVDSTAWMVPQEGSVYGQALAVQFAGTLLVAAVIDATHVELFNPGYSGNAIAGALIPIGARVGVSGTQAPSPTLGGPAGGDLQGNYPNPLLIDTGTPATIGDATHVAQVTTDNAGRVITLTSIPITYPAAPSLGTMAAQNANAVAITGGTISGVAISGASTIATSGAVAVGALSATAFTLTGKFALPPSSLQTLGAANVVLSNAAKIRVVSNGGVVAMVSTPTFAPGTVDGQELLVQGTSDTDAVVFQSNGTLAGSAVRLGANTRQLGKGDTLRLTWDSTEAQWFETSYTDLVL